MQRYHEQQQEEQQGNHFRDDKFHTFYFEEISFSPSFSSQMESEKCVTNGLLIQERITGPSLVNFLINVFILFSISLL